MNFKNIHLRVLLWFSLTLFFSAATIFSSFYLVTKQILYRQVDKELASHADQMSSLTTQQISNFSNIPGMVIVSLDHSGTVINSSLGPDTQYIDYDTLYKMSQKNNDPFFVNQSLGGTAMRFIVDPIRNEEKLQGVILLAHPIEAIQRSLDALLAILGVILLILIIPSLLGGHFIAEKIIQPISIISNKMSKISSEHLDERVDDPGSDDEISNLATTFNNLLSRLQNSFQRERQFIGDVAHELKTPIATLQGGIELALSKSRNKNEYIKSLNETLIDTNRLSSTINNILDLAWLNAENIGNHFKPINLTAVLRDLQEITIKLAGKKQIKVKFNLGNKVIIDGVEDKIVRALLNIIDNAIKFTPNGGSISLKLRQTNQKAIIQVKDGGIGISKEELPHVFERFYRGSKTSKTFGSGLGLAITQGIIRLHRGNMAISSAPGKGTTVKLSLPLS